MRAAVHCLSITLMKWRMYTRENLACEVAFVSNFVIIYSSNYQDNFIVPVY